MMLEIWLPGLFLLGLVTKWIKDNPSTPQPKASDLAVLFFENFSQDHPGMFPSAVTQTGADGKPQSSIQRSRRAHVLEVNLELGKRYGVPK